MEDWYPERPYPFDVTSPGPYQQRGVAKASIWPPETVAPTDAEPADPE
jgi:hypothetical protein